MILQSILGSNVEASFQAQKSFRNKTQKENFLIIADLNNIHSADSTIILEVMDSPDYIKDFTFLENRVKVIYAAQ